MPARPNPLTRRMTRVKENESLTYTSTGLGTTLTYHDSAGNEEVIHGDDIIAVVPEPDEELPRKVIFTGEHNEPDHPDGIPHIKSLVASTGLPQELVNHYGRPFGQIVHKESHVVISTLSGTQQAKHFFSEAAKPVLDNLHDYQDYHVHYTESASSITELANSLFLPRANTGRALRIILLSGDGGIIDLVNAFLSAISCANFKAPEVVLLPLGTGNALAHSIGVAKDNTMGLGMLARGRPRPVPGFKVKFSPGARLLVDEARAEEDISKDEDGTPVMYGVVVCSWGMHASLVGDSDTAQYRKHGAERFKMAATEALFPNDGSPPHAYKAKVSVRRAQSGWESIPRAEHMYVLATLVSNLEKTFTISPASKPLDGQLRLVHFGPMSGNEIMAVMGKAYQGGKHVEDPSVGYVAIEGLRIVFDGTEEDGRWRRICVDGKIIRVEEDGWIELSQEPRHVLDVVCEPLD